MESDIQMRSYLRMLIEDKEDEVFVRQIDTLFVGEAKSFKFARDEQVWKEIGFGFIFIVKLKTESFSRLVQWRGETGSVAMNHYIMKEIPIQLVSSSSNTHCWTSIEKDMRTFNNYAAKFKLPEVGDYFKETFEKCSSLGGFTTEDLEVLKERFNTCWAMEPSNALTSRNSYLEESMDSVTRSEVCYVDAESGTLDELFIGKGMNLKKPLPKKSLLKRMFGCNIS